MDDLRRFIDKVEKVGELARIAGADWNLEIGTIADLNLKRNKPPALLFDDIKDYPTGYRLLSSAMATPNRTALALDLPTGLSDLALIDVLRQKLPEWAASVDRFPPEKVAGGPVMENVHSGRDVNLWEFPSPKWHELDGGRYIGTGDAVITRDPESGEVNLGTYRVMVHDETTLGIHASPGKHGRIHHEKWHALGKPCPVAVSFGHHPLFFGAGTLPLPAGQEYRFIGAVRGERVRVIEEEITGLPVPADSEIVIAGFLPPGRSRQEGPFGEWTGYYASKDRPAPIIEVKRIYHRNNPILLGSQNCVPPSDSSYFSALMRSAQLHTELVRCGIPDVAGVWVGMLNMLYLFIVVSIKQRYAGHAKQAALLASQLTSGGAYHGRYVVVVDEDIDPTNPQEVLWAICTRSDPVQDIDILRRCWSTPLDPTIRKPATAFFNSRAIIDACKPFEWKDEFPQEIKISPQLVDRVKSKWGNAIGL
ncbi:MAG: UbiD family decarboxylase [Chloroflexi bacterium]|nr:UbiD family decarboxylase [Chloroflexota bacterium]